MQVDATEGTYANEDDEISGVTKDTREINMADEAFRKEVLSKLDLLGPILTARLLQ